MPFYPVCRHCNKPIGQYEDEYLDRFYNKNESISQILDDFKIKKQCCVMTFATYNKVIEDIIPKYNYKRE